MNLTYPEIEGAGLVNEKVIREKQLESDKSELKKFKAHASLIQSQ